MKGTDEAPSDAPATARSRHGVLEWQKRMLPFMATMLVVLAMVSLAFNIYEVRVVQEHILASPQVKLGEVWAGAERSSTVDAFAYARWKALTLLEANAMERRYHQANTITMSRLYLIFLGFATGMVLALVGATFILGKLQESPTTLGGGVEGGWKVSMATASPGIVLAVLGTTLILSTIWARGELNVRDSRLFLESETFALAPAAKNEPVSSQTPKTPDEIAAGVRKRLAGEAPPDEKGKP